MTEPTDPERHVGWCPVCGFSGAFPPLGGHEYPARKQPCPACSSALIFQAEAAVLLDEFALGGQLSLDGLLRDPSFRALHAYYMGRSGPIRGRLKSLDHYAESVWVPDEAPGTQIGPRYRTVQDHMALTYASESFDLMMSSHVLEHVPDPRAALREAARVLRPGGRYIISIPCRWPLPHASTVRAVATSEGVEHLLEPAFHRSPEGEPALVFTDFGSDIIDMAAEAGLLGSIRRPFRHDRRTVRLFVVVLTKPQRVAGRA